MLEAVFSMQSAAKAASYYNITKAGIYTISAPNAEDK
jgi:hypothetical protein